MISNYRSIPVKRFTPNALRILDLAWRISLQDGDAKISAAALAVALEDFEEHEIVAEIPRPVFGIGFNPIVRQTATYASSNTTSWTTLV